MSTAAFRKLVLGLAVALPCAAASAQDYTLNFLVNYGTRYWSPTDINNRGQVVGTMGDSHSPNAVTWDALRPGRPPTYLPFDTQCCMYAESWGYAINDRGQVVGEDTYRAALWEGANRPTLLPPGSVRSAAYGLNEAGAVVGYSYFEGTGLRATLWDAGGAHDLGTLGGTESYAYAINESGTVAGMSLAAGSGYPARATVWQGGSLTDLGAGYAYNLNDLGQVVGMSMGRAALWNGTQVSFLGGLDTVAADINNSGWVVGSRFDEFAEGNPRSAMLWYGGRTIDLNSFLSQAERDAGWHLESAVAINDHGWIVGTAYNDLTFDGTAYVLSIPAIPEPASIAMLMAGLGVIGVVARRARRNTTCT